MRHAPYQAPHMHTVLMRHVQSRQERELQLYCGIGTSGEAAAGHLHVVHVFLVQACRYLQSLQGDSMMWRHSVEQHCTYHIVMGIGFG